MENKRHQHRRFQFAQKSPNIKSNYDIEETVKKSFATWENAANLKLNIIWTNKTSISQTNAGDGISLITIADAPENVAQFQAESVETAGRTRVFFTKRGVITEADIALNPFRQFSTDGTIGTYDLQSTLTHEIGHILGLDHSSIWAATMYAHQGKNGTFSLSAFAPQSLSEDDRAGIRSLYGAPNDLQSDCCSAIAGTITASDGKPLSNWMIWAEDSTTGKLAAASLIKNNGAFRIEGLEIGRYNIFAETDFSHREVLQINNSVELGKVSVEASKTTVLNRKFTPRQINFNPNLIGFNGQLSTLAVPVENGRSSFLFLGGDKFPALSNVLLTTSSPFLTINPTSLNVQDFGAKNSVFSFELVTQIDAPTGEYSLRWRTKTGDVFHLVGCMSVENKRDEAVSTEDNNQL
ncbi:MAG: matrixin family metalloprotease [Pyrinomonadaceae bacterium]|nr:matrixin family metalloprotease [Pyrinomonadaceae bacterium]